MYWQIEIMLYLLLLVTALLSLQVKNLLAAVGTTTAYSLTTAVLFISMGAVDVGFTEAMVGAGVVGVFYVAVLFKTNRRSED